MYVPPPFAQLAPYVFAADAGSYLDFLCQAFGGVELGRTLGPDGSIANGQVQIGEAALMVSEASERFPPSQSSFYLYVADAEAAHARAVGAGCEEVMPVMDMPYGDRQGGVRDPQGNLWWISQRIVEEPYSF